MRNRIFNVKKIYILVFVVFGLIVLLDHSSTFLLYFQLLFTQKKKKKAKYLSVWVCSSYALKILLKLSLNILI